MHKHSAVSLSSIRVQRTLSSGRVGQVALNNNLHCAASANFLHWPVAYYTFKYCLINFDIVGKHNNPH